MTLAEDLEHMQRHESFARIVQEISEMREDCIKELSAASTEQVQQISGKLLAYDEITSLLGSRLLAKRFPNI